MMVSYSRFVTDTGFQVSACQLNQDSETSIARKLIIFHVADLDLI